MIRTPSGKNLMNLQEAVQWLLDNNALPFQCTADYVGGAEIGLGTIVNPTPAKVRVGSLIFFADSKVSTVIAITSNSFICSDEYNDLVDDVVYVSNVQLNASGHLIVTLSNGTNIDAGLIKQVASFSINASQHLIANYNDGTSTDLGAIFTGDISITGNLNVSGSINGEATPSVKPIYFHPIYAQYDDPTYEAKINFLILDNNATPYDSTTFVNKITALMEAGALIQANGYVLNKGTLTAYQVFMLLKTGTNTYTFYINSANGFATINMSTLTLTNLFDGVNKIN